MQPFSAFELTSDIRALFPRKLTPEKEARKDQSETNLAWFDGEADKPISGPGRAWRGPERRALLEFGVKPQ